MSTDKENEKNRPLADMPNAAADLNLTSAGPWRFDLRDRSPMAVTAVAEFAEMLCVVDPRFGDALPVNWMRLPYIVALMDALRCAYVSAFIENKHYSAKGATFKAPAVPGEQQVRFWMNENHVLGLITAYTRADGIEHQTNKGEKFDKLPPRTIERREQERSAGVEPVEYYAYLNSMEVPAAPDVYEPDVYEPDAAIPPEEEAAGQPISGPVGPDVSGDGESGSRETASPRGSAGSVSPWLAAGSGDPSSQASA